MKKIEDDELIRMLQDKAKELGREPKIKDVDNDENMPSTITYYKRFGPWTETLRRAGISKREFHQIYSTEQMLDFIRVKAKELGRSPTITEIDADKNMPSLVAYYGRFGSWSQALEEAGLTAQNKRRTDEEMLEFMRNKIEELGRRPSEQEINADRNMPSVSTYRNHFGTLQNVFKLLR